MKILIALFYLLIPFSITAQTQEIADTQASKLIDVIIVYEQVVEDGFANAYIYEKLANAYYFKSEYEKAIIYFERLFDLEKSQDETLLYRYNQSLKALDLYDTRVVEATKG